MRGVFIWYKHVWSQKVYVHFISVLALLNLYGCVAASCIWPKDTKWDSSGMTESDNGPVMCREKLAVDCWFQFSKLYLSHFMPLWNTNACKRPRIRIAAVYGGCAERLILWRVRNWRFNVFVASVGIVCVDGYFCTASLLSLVMNLRTKMSFPEFFPTHSHRL